MSFSDTASEDDGQVEVYIYNDVDGTQMWGLTDPNRAGRYIETDTPVENRE